MKALTKIERILTIMDILKKHSDEVHELTVQDIIEYLVDRYEEVDFHKDAIRNDLKDIYKSSYFDLTKSQQKGLPTYYSYQDRLFEIHELRILMDAVVSARFITIKEKERIIDKLKQLTSEYLAKNLNNQLYIRENSSSENSIVRYSIDTIHRALQGNKQIQFKYGRYNTKKEFVLSREGKVRVFNPYALYWNNDYYYLIGVEPDDPQKTIHFRVDRMRDVKLSDDSFVTDEQFDVSTYTNKLFHMYSGVEKFLKVQFDNHLINVVIDRFGKGVNIEEIDDHSFILRTRAVMSQGLIRWMLTWGSDAKVIDPPELAEAIKEESKKMFHLYNN